MLLYIWTSYRVLGIVYLNQLKGARHTHISYHDSTTPKCWWAPNSWFSPGESAIFLEFTQRAIHKVK